MQWTAITQEADGLGESPFWHPSEKLLYWVDIPGRRLRRCDIVSGEAESWAMPAEPGCIAPALSGGLVVALRDGVYRARRWGGPLELLARPDYDARDTRFNDGKCDPLGRFWVGSLYEPRDRRLGALYCLDMRGGRPPVLRRVLRDNVVANGLAWSPDGRCLYWANTFDHVVHAWDWEAASARLGARRVLRQFPAKPEGWTWGDPRLYGGRPDGASVDSEGHYWVAMFEGGRLLELDAAGALLAELPLPVPCPTMLCFGGDDLRTLFVTSAGWERPPAERAAYPLAGRILTGRTPAVGRPVNFFDDGST